ncbi:MAG: thiosulfate oxidation carrier protein SoxY [Hyphomicrobiaceae bacterium]|nr:MAG: thiosulfate oxidation carrier protein SoxY [Hyphomicrobiaceae bacterium]
MKRQLRLDIVHRRDVLLGAAGAAAFISLLAMGGKASAQENVPTAADLLKSIHGDAKPTEARINVDLPEIAENGNTVPFGIVVESPMTGTDYVKAIHVVATGNPRPEVATFLLTPDSGKAAISSRMRLGKTQDIIVVAEMSDGKFYMGKRAVKVTIGGCGG